MLSFLLKSSVVLALVSDTVAQFPPDLKAATTRELEHLYLDNAASNLYSMITPCTQYIDSSTGKANNNLGRQTSAEWVRVAFHDFVTGNIYNGLGGLDASIQYETKRDENKGTAFNDALINFNYFFNRAVSMADLIALGVAISAGKCGGSPMAMQGGRIDATAAGPTGVPQPQQPLGVQLEQFGNAGFNMDDTIALTACGHSMGGVHRNTFPDIIPNPPTALMGGKSACSGSDCRIAFDSSIGTLDNCMVTDYVSNVGSRGGPLVTTPNVTDQSDRRLFEADGNATMHRMAASNSYYVSQCASLFGRMITTVPNGVQLSPSISPTSSSNNLKIITTSLNVDKTGNMVLNGVLRYVQVAGTSAAPSSISVTLVGRNGKVTDVKTTAIKAATDAGTGVFGPTYQYYFRLSFPAATGLGGIQANGQPFALQDTMFVQTGLSSVMPAQPSFSATPSLGAKTSEYSFNLTVAYLMSGAPSTLKTTLSVPVSQSNSVAPRIDSSTTAILKKTGTIGSFSIYSTIVKKTLSAKQVYGSSFDVAEQGKAPGVVFFKPFSKM